MSIVVAMGRAAKRNAIVAIDSAGFISTHLSVSQSFGSNTSTPASQHGRKVVSHAAIEFCTSRATGRDARLRESDPGGGRNELMGQSQDGRGPAESSA